MTDDRVRQVAIFFMFTLMDEKLAVQAAHDAIAQIKAHKDPDDATIARILSRTFESHRKTLSRNRPAVMPEALWQLPPNVDSSAWQKFHRDSSDAEIVALALAKILKIKEDALSKGLSLSPGTVRYRVGKATKHLGTKL